MLNTLTVLSADPAVTYVLSSTITRANMPCVWVVLTFRAERRKKKDHKKILHFEINSQAK